MDDPIEELEPTEAEEEYEEDYDPKDNGNQPS